MFGVLNIALQTAAAPKLALSEQVSAAVSTLFGKSPELKSEDGSKSYIRFLVSPVDMGISQGLS